MIITATFAHSVAVYVLVDIETLSNFKRCPDFKLCVVILLLLLFSIFNSLVGFALNKRCVSAVLNCRNIDVASSSQWTWKDQYVNLANARTSTLGSFNELMIAFRMEVASFAPVYISKNSKKKWRTCAVNRL